MVGGVLWSGARWKAKFYSVTGFVLPWLAYARAVSWQTAAAMRSRITSLVQEEFAVAANERNVGVDAALCSPDPRRAFQTVRTLKPRAPQKQWRVTAAVEAPSLDYVQERLVFRYPFGKLLLGTPSSFESVVETERTHAHQAAYRDDVLQGYCGIAHTFGLHSWQRASGCCRGIVAPTFRPGLPCHSVRRCSGWAAWR